MVYHSLLHHMTTHYCLIGALNLTHEEFHTTVAPTAVGAVSCDGSEASLTDCPHSTLTKCGAISDAGVVCQGETNPFSTVV